VWNPDVYPKSRGWNNRDLNEQEMEEEHGRELEKIRSQEKGNLLEFGEAAGVGGGKEPGSSIRRFFGTVRDLNETIKNWKGE